MSLVPTLTFSIQNFFRVHVLLPVKDMDSALDSLLTISLKFVVLGIKCQF